MSVEQFVDYRYIWYQIENLTFYTDSDIIDDYYISNLEIFVKNIQADFKKKLMSLIQVRNNELLSLAKLEILANLSNPNHLESSTAKSKLPYLIVHATGSQVPGWL